LNKTIVLGLELVDRQLLDSADRRCGNVDDLALEGGLGAWRRRAGLIGRFAAWVGGGSVVEAVVRIGGDRIVVRDDTELE
jgi:hypothetical protein